MKRLGSLTRLAALVAGSWLLVAASALPSALGEDDTLKFTTERVVVFKDGYCMLVKHAKATTNEQGELITAEVPDEAVLGSIWIDALSAGEGAEVAKLKNVVASAEQHEEQETKEMSCATLVELLKANLGADVTLVMQQGDTVQGSLKKLVGEPESVTSVDPATAITMSTERASASHVIVETSFGDTVVSVSEIRRVLGATLETMTTRTTTRKVQRKEWCLQFDRPNTEVEIRLIYFRSGIRWIPTYRVALTDNPNEAIVNLQAELINEAEDLSGTAIDLVVGVPNFRFRETPSPLTMEAAMRNTLAVAAPNLMSNGMINRSQAMFSQRAGEFDPGVNQVVDNVPSIPAEFTGSGAQDLFVIHLDKMELGKGDRAVVPISEQTVACRHVYTWKVSLRRNDSETAPTQSGTASPLSLTTNEVWHQLELVNNSDAPWTTGAAMILEGTQPLAQELLTYTSPGGTVRLPITVAVDLRGDYEEKETDRQLNAIRWNDWAYAKISKETLVTLINRKSEAVDFEIECHMPGTASGATDGAEIVLMSFDPNDWENYRGDPVVNQHSIIRYRGSLEAGKEVELKINSYYFSRQ